MAKELGRTSQKWIRTNSCMWKGVWGLDRNGVPEDLPQYIGQTENLVKYSKFDNFVQRTQEPYQVQHFRCVTLTDGTVKKTPLSIQNIEHQERRL